MSRRNYKPTEGPLGKYRVRSEVSPEIPEVNTDKLLDLQQWRVEEYKKPILDDLLAWYRFDPPTAETARTYTGKNRHFSPTAKAVGKEAVRQLIANKEERLAAGERQVGHIASGAEEMLALFLMTAEFRKRALQQTLSTVIKEGDVDTTDARHAAEAIEDMGDCISEPFEPKRDGIKRQVVPDEQIIEAVDHFALGVGQQISAFGRYAADNTDALHTDTGIILMQSAYEEQEHRINAWRPRHDALQEAFPEMELSMDILLERVSLDEMLRIQEARR